MEEGSEEETCTPSLCYINGHTGFRGSIKNSARDFVVIEVNVNGQLVHSLENMCQISKCSEDYVNETIKNRKVARSLEDEHYAEKEIVMPPYNNDIQTFQTVDIAGACEESLDLDFVLDTSVNEELTQYAMTIRLCPGSSVDEKVRSTELSLGTYPDKNQRASVHRAVRHKFPFLMTLTNNCEILVKEDPHYNMLAQLVSEEESEDFFRFLDDKVQRSTFTFKPDNDKEHRKAVHHFVNKHFGKLVETKSFAAVDSGGPPNTAITVRFREKKMLPKKRKATDYQEDDTIYTAFTLQKENLETLEAISYMASAFGVLPSDFTYAGIKDKRAITYQSMVVKKVSLQRLREMCPEFQNKGIYLHHTHPVSQPLRLGALQGNHFDIIVRDLRKHSDDDDTTDLQQLVQEALENVKSKGFVNYYGPQRFGTGQTIQADQIGLALLKEDMVLAVKLFFTPEENSDPQNKAKRHFLQTEDAKESLALMPEFKVRERMMLRALNRYGVGHEGCIRGWLSLPHGMRVLYIHAYCSRVWNEAASFRLQQFGEEVVKGDLVWSTDMSKESTVLRHNQVHVVTAEEESGKIYKLSQVILPLPGNSVKYPDNEVGDWYQKRFAEDGLQSCRFRVTPLKLNIPGCYRPLLSYPRNLTHQFLEDCPGVISEQSLLPHSKSSSTSLALSFDLDSSCYATVCLREIMKCDP
ncbi:pseudouridylate synthase PUS7L [Lepisosteus oculatus]|uniref:pseudouridylate synthase PUS7L n=1 Tax=Lepisosteus oculatus TaxID=7918 RepID=UPI00371A508D